MCKGLWTFFSWLLIGWADKPQSHGCISCSIHEILKSENLITWSLSLAIIRSTLLSKAFLRSLITSSTIPSSHILTPHIIRATASFLIILFIYMKWQVLPHSYCSSHTCSQRKNSSRFLWSSDSYNRAKNARRRYISSGLRGTQCRQNDWNSRMSEWGLLWIKTDLWLHSGIPSDVVSSPQLQTPHACHWKKYLEELCLIL